jgi:hypothetical protein
VAAAASTTTITLRPHPHRTSLGPGPTPIRPPPASIGRPSTTTAARTARAHAGHATRKQPDTAPASYVRESSARCYRPCRFVTIPLNAIGYELPSQKPGLWPATHAARGSSAQRWADWCIYNEPLICRERARPPSAARLIAAAQDQPVAGIVARETSLADWTPTRLAPPLHSRLPFTLPLPVFHPEFQRSPYDLHALSPINERVPLLIHLFQHLSIGPLPSSAEDITPFPLPTCLPRPRPPT